MYYYMLDNIYRLTICVKLVNLIQMTTTYFDFRIVKVTDINNVKNLDTVSINDAIYF